jgi:hypothetical protein
MYSIGVDMLGSSALQRRRKELPPRGQMKNEQARGLSHTIGDEL